MSSRASDLPAVTEAATATSSTTGGPPTDATTTTGGAAYDPALSRDDVDCGPVDSESIVSAHYVIDGVLGSLCLGDEEEGLFAAWDLLTTITPPRHLAPLAVLAAFDDPASDTAAFVSVIGDDDGSDFQMTINLAAAVSGDPEFAITVAHEFAHILVGEVDQLDRFAEEGSCPTYDNGEGCFYDGAYLEEWVDAFWSADELAQLGDPEAEEATAVDRCERNAGFLGEYAATNPDEDFAESFAAFVFQVHVDGPELEDKIAFLEELPDLVEFRDRAAAAGLAFLPNTFDVCG